jgi:SAM-dependent methyltransferase
MGTYLFEQDWDHERRRLDLLEELFDPITKEHLGRLPLPGGRQCLEVGGGAGSVVRWLCDEVGPDGRVVATDLDTRFLEQLTEKNLEVRRHNVLTDELEEETYDLVHSRLVLDFFPERQAEVIGRLVSALRPGGWLVLEDFDWSTLAAISGCAQGERLGRVHDALRLVFPVGAPELGRGLPLSLGAAGLADVGADGRVRVAVSGSPAMEWWQLTLLALRPRLLDTGRFSEAEVDDMLEGFDDDGFCFLLPAMITAWGRRPLG